GRVTARRLEFEGIDLLTASEPAMRDIRGHRIAMVLQDPKFSLNPVMPVGDQVAEAWRGDSGAARGEGGRGGAGVVGAGPGRGGRRASPATIPTRSRAEWGSAS